MKPLLMTLGILLLNLGVFVAGYLYRDATILSRQPYVTTQSLKLYSGARNSEVGLLPKGTTLYSFDGPDELPHFLVVIGTKALDKLELTDKHNLYERDPLEAASD